MAHIHGNAAVIDNTLLIQSLLIGCVVSFDLLHGRNQGIIQRVQILTGIDIGAEEAEITGFFTGSTHGCLNHLVDRGIALLGCSGCHLFHHAVHIGLRFCIQLESGFLCCHIQGSIPAPGA